MKRAGRILDESAARMKRMLFANVKAAYEKMSVDKVVVGADEMNRLKTHNYLTVFAGLMAKLVLFNTPVKDSSVLIDICCGIAAAQGLSQGHPACGQRHECGLHQRRKTQLWERSGWFTTRSTSSRMWWRLVTRSGRRRAGPTPGSGVG